MTERRHRQVFIVLVLLGAVLQALSMLYLHVQPDASVRVWPTRVGMLLIVFLLAASLWPRVPLRSLQRLAIGTLFVWFVLNVNSVLQTARPITSGLLIHVVILGLCSFTWLPRAVAGVIVVVSFTLLVGAGAVSSVPDPPGALLVGFTLPLIWYLTVYGREVSRERVRNELLRTLAYRDPLTGVHNRRSGSETLSALLERPAGGSGPWAGPEVEVTELAVALFDLDHFKRINDLHGHQHGDRVLMAVAVALQTALRPGDQVVRWGGEEFMAILDGVTRSQARTQVAAALQAVRALRLDGLPAITVSAGLAYSGETADPDALLDLADGRLYQAKAAGRDRVH